MLGQLISLLITGTGSFSTLLAQDHIDIPTTQSSLNYILLSIHLIWALPRVCREGLAAPLRKYVLWAFIDVEANYLVVSAYQYTSIASIMLLDCFAIPCVMILSCCILKARYTRWHCVACLVCIMGMVLTVLSDTISGKGAADAKQPAWLGDVMVLAGAALYGLSNVCQESLLKTGGHRSEALGALGFFGSLLSCAQASLVERRALAECVWTMESLAWLLGFQLCLFGMYVLTSKFLMIADAAVFNLSLLTSDFYSVLFSWGVQGQQPTWLYGAAFVTTISGLLLYHSQPVVVGASPNCLPEEDDSFLGGVGRGT